jgi:hypothetical protein
MPHVDFPQTQCRAALTRRDITPPVGIYHRMWGAATHEQSTGIHRPLLATALAVAPWDESQSAAANAAPQANASPLTNPGPQAIVGIDHCLLWRADLDVLRTRAARVANLQLDQLHVAFSHTHAAGLMDPARADRPGGQLIAGYLEQMAEQIGHAVGEALAALVPAHMVYGMGRCGLARHRDFWDTQNGHFVCGLNPAGLSDDTVMVARITDADARVLGTIVNYACHPTTLAWDNTLVSPDFVGAMRETVEGVTGAPCLFLQGASGDLGPRHGFVGDTDVADRNGRELGYAALAALEALAPPGVRLEYLGPVVSGATIGNWDYRPLNDAMIETKRRWHAEHFRIALARRPDLPSREETEAQRAGYQAEVQNALRRGDALRAREASALAERSERQLARLRSLDDDGGVSVGVTLLSLGDAAWVLVSAEHYQLLQRSLRERFGRVPIVVATLADGWAPGYLPTVETFGKGIYQESIAVVAPGSLEKVVETIAARIGRWFGEHP